MGGPRSSSRGAPPQRSGAGSTGNRSGASPLPHRREHLRLCRVAAHRSSGTVRASRSRRLLPPPWRSTAASPTREPPVEQSPERPWRLAASPAGVDDHREAKQAARRIRKASEQFAAEFGALNCRDLIGYDLLEDHDAFIESGTGAMSACARSNSPSPGWLRWPIEMSGMSRWNGLAVSAQGRTVICAPGGPRSRPS